jgi:hypothetical protein
MNPQQNPPLSEGQVGRAPQGGAIQYTPLTSCLTVTVTLQNGEQVGGHLSMSVPSQPGAHQSDQILNEMRNLIGNDQIASVHIDGFGDTWSPSFLAMPAFAPNGDSNYAQQPPPQSGMNPMRQAICQQLGYNGQSVTTNNRD